jgi:hypothetical protein
MFEATGTIATGVVSNANLGTKGDHESLSLGRPESVGECVIYFCLWHMCVPDSPFGMLSRWPDRGGPGVPDKTREQVTEDERADVMP